MADPQKMDSDLFCFMFSFSYLRKKRTLSVNKYLCEENEKKCHH